ncbi:MAG: hypothetical protein O2821_08545 [Chloroflexi bacterium]|nr:hypothetical protein [Chloroflexota bacterium]MDA1228180.1 hypothetical protein [Chloroflexota bacterium]
MNLTRARTWGGLLGALILTAACGSQAPVQEAGPSAGVAAQPPPAAEPLLTPTGVAELAPPGSTATGAPSSTEAPPVVVQTADIGHTVGDQIPGFELTLVDGSKFTSQDLISQGRPVFLFFTASW